MQKLLITGGILLILIGIGLPWLQKVGLGQLPGDISLKRQHFSFYFPITTCLVISAIISALRHLFHQS